MKTVLYARGHETTDNAQVDGTIVPVLAKVGGYVRTVSVDENEHVKLDQPLVLIDPSEYAVKLAQADADLAAAAYVAGHGGVGGPGGGAGRAARRASAQVARCADRGGAVGEAKADADLAREKELAAKQIVSKQQLDAAQAASTRPAPALCRGRAAGRRGRGAVVQRRDRREVRAGAMPERPGRARQRGAAALVHEESPRRSPGIVCRKQVEVGQLVQAGQPLLTIVADTGVWITANFKETQLADLRVGQPVDDRGRRVSAAAKRRGKVESLSAATGAKFALLPPDNATGNFTKVVQRVPVRIRVTKGCGADRPLAPGHVVRARRT